MTKVTKYLARGSGTSDGFQNQRAEIRLMNGRTLLGWVRFHDEGMPFPGDAQAGDKILMHLPSAMFENVLDLLRNEKAVHFYFKAGHAFLGTEPEPAGEGERERPRCPELPGEVPLSRSPIFVEWRSFNYFTRWKQFPDSFAEELNAYPPAVLYAEGGFGGHVENPFQWGAVKGVVNEGEPDAEVYGNEVTPDIGPIFDAGLADPETLRRRFAELPVYLAEYEGISVPAPYVDFATQVFGNRVARTGFWSFYDQWDRYAQPAGGPEDPERFDLGPRPPDPETWLRRWHDPDNSSSCPTPGHKNCVGLSEVELENLRGLSFAYGPKKLGYEPYLRFSVCVNTEGWALWMRQVMRWVARVGFKMAYIDNARNFGQCWNDECQAGYRAWLAQNFSAAEIDRFFKVSTSLLPDHSFESNWFQVENEGGAWSTNYASAAEGGAMFPDVDSYGGRHSARLEGPGELRLAGHPFDATSREEKDYRLTVHYKTGGDVGASVRVSQAGANAEFNSQPLPQSAAWAEVNVEFHVPADVQFVVSFKTERAGSLWLDELWLSHVTVRGGRKVFDHPTFETGLWDAVEDNMRFSERLRNWAALAYWDFAADEKLLRLRDAAREVRPDFQLLTNSSFQRKGSDYFMAEFQALEFEDARQEAGHPPGVYRPAPAGEPPQLLRGRTVASEVLNANDFDYKYVHSKRRADAFAYFVHQAASVLPAGGVAPRYLQNPDSSMLLHAEVAAFGAGAAADMGLRRYRQFYRDVPELRTELQEGSRAFFKFVAEHPEAYEGLRSYAEVGLIYHGIRPTTADQDAIFDLARGLAGRGVLWDLLTEERCTAAHFACHKVLILHAVELLPEAAARALLEFMERGGLVIASGSDAGAVMGQNEFHRFYVGMLDEFFRLRAADPEAVWPPVRLDGTRTVTQDIGSGRLVSVPAGKLDARLVIRSVENFFADAGINRRLGVFSNLRAAALERTRAAAWAAPGRLVLHLLNYNVPVGIENRGQVERLDGVRVALKPPGAWEPSSVRLLTPEESGASGEVPFSVTPDGVVKFTVPRLHIYGLALMQ